MIESSISIIIPVYNEENNIQPLLDELFSVLENKLKNFEVIVVDDGSADATSERLKSYSENIILPIYLKENRGQSGAIFEGIKHAKYEIIALMDGDMQYDPKDILHLFTLLNKDFRLVSGVRKERNDTWFYRFSSKAGNKFIRFLFGHEVNDIGCGLKIAYKEDLQNLIVFKNIHRYLSVLFHLNGLKTAEMEINHRQRLHGKSKYSIWKTFGILKELNYIQRNKGKFLTKTTQNVR